MPQHTCRRKRLGLAAGSLINGWNSRQLIFECEFIGRCSSVERPIQDSDQLTDKGRRLIHKNLGMHVKTEITESTGRTRALNQPTLLFLDDKPPMFKIIDDRDRFEVELDVSSFDNEHLKVKAVDNTIVIEGKRQDKHEFLTKEFIRRFVVPSDVDMDRFTSTLSNGILKVIGPKMAPIKPPPRQRIIPVLQTGRFDQ